MPWGDLLIGWGEGERERELNLERGVMRGGGDLERVILLLDRGVAAGKLGGISLSLAIINQNGMLNVQEVKYEYSAALNTKEGEDP